MKRILVAGMHHESNSFNPIVTGENNFRIIRGAKLFTTRTKTNALSGIIDTLKAAGYEIIPTLTANAVPNGEVDYNFYCKIKAEILQEAQKALQAGPIDAITLSLHGSMRIKGFDEAEGYLLEELRQLCPNIPIFSSLDTHTTMTQRMYKNCDGFVAYKCSPHIDAYETGVHAAQMTIAALENKIHAHSAWVKVPILIAGEQSSTTVEPAKSLRQELIRTEEKNGILASSYLMGFPWSDNKDSSIAAFVVAETQELANTEALRLAELIWNTRNEFCFQTETYSEQEALDIAFNAILNNQNTPIYLSDSGDNPTAGSSSDCTGFLRLIMQDSRTNNLKNPVLYGGIYDPEATLACKGKIGQTLTLTFGAKFDTNTSQPITASGTVISYIENWDKASVKTDLALFRSCGVDIVLTETHVGYTTPDIFTDLGRNPADAEIVVCKLGYLTAAQAKIAKRSIMALSKGSTNEDLKTLHYTKIPRPIFPLDTDFTYDAKANLISK